MNLRPYQFDLFNAMRRSLATGHRRIMCVAPCGAGKSVIMQAVVESAQIKNNTVMILAHRQEIVDQLAERMKPYGNATVMMMQTAVRRLDALPTPSIIIIDESHLIKANSYMRILEHFSNSYALYFTATPKRLDGKGFDDVADDLIQSVSVRWLIENGYLAPFEYYAPKTLIDASQLAVKQGEYDGKQAAAMLDKPKIYGDVIQEYRKHADGLQAIAFCSSVEHSQRTADAFNAAGIAAAHVDGKMTKKQRREIVHRFRDGKITVLCNYAIVIEGLDVPNAACVLCLRPTQSLTVHVQSVMRCMRPAPGKVARILDFVGNYERLGLPDDDREWSLQGRKKRTRQKERNTVRARVCENCFRTYAGNGRECPYCGHTQPKTQAEIEQDERAELERITAENRKQKRMEVGRARTLEDLLRIAQERNYKPGWAYVKAKQKGIRI